MVSTPAARQAHVFVTASLQLAPHQSDNQIPQHYTFAKRYSSACHAGCPPPRKHRKGRRRHDGSVRHLFGEQVPRRGHRTKFISRHRSLKSIKTLMQPMLASIDSHQLSVVGFRKSVDDGLINGLRGSWSSVQRKGWLKPACLLKICVQRRDPSSHPRNRGCLMRCFLGGPCR
jgi:hypothetical protein